jgi:hypothetical protein
VNWSNNAIDGV